MPNNQLLRLYCVVSLLLLSIVQLWAQDDYLKRHRLPNNINTTYTETKPIISYDNTILYLTRQNHPDNHDGKKDDQDVYFSLRDENAIWGTPVNIGEPLNNEHPNGISSLSIGGDSILVINEFYDYGYEKGASLSVKEEQGWSSPQPIMIEKFRNNSGYVDYFISANGQHLFLAIESKKTFGDQDIYISNRIDAYHWSEPVNLGMNINTGEAEFSPFLSSDNKTLFFSSYGHEGFGNCDIFYSERLDDTWAHWSPAKNMGENINTEGFEAYFTIPSKGDWAYFVSDINSNEDSRDIFRAIIPLELNPTPGVIVSGVTYNETDKQPTIAQVEVIDVEGQTEKKKFVTNDAKRSYRRSILEFPKTFQLLAESEGFMSTSQYLTIKYSDKREIKRDLYMVPISIGNTLVSHDVSFLPASNTLNEKGIYEVGRMVNYMKKYPDINMAIDSYVAKTDDKEEDNQLAAQRKETVYDFFIKEGIDPKRLSASSHGSDEPFYNVDNLLIFEGNNFDDRVSFTIYADEDGDGVANEKDKCIDEPGIPENEGCPAISEEILGVFNVALQGIQFETSKDIIKPSSFGILNNVADIMKDNEHFFLKIAGHTDSQGANDANQVLSEGRAASTLDYLVNKGVSVERLKDYGFGETQPVETNDTAAGRSKNRRVVFEIVFDKSKL